MRFLEMQLQEAADALALALAPFTSGPTFNLGSNVPPYSLLILHVIPWNSPYTKMDKGHIGV